MTYLLHITTVTGAVSTLTCPSALVRGLWIISLANQAVSLRSEDRAFRV